MNNTNKKYGLAKNKTISFILVSLILVFVLFTQYQTSQFARVEAITAKEYDNQIATLKDKQQSNSVKRAEIQTNIQNIQTQMHDKLQLKAVLDEEIILIQDEMDTAEKLAELFEKKSEELKREKEEVQKSYDENYELFKEIVRYSYEEGNQDYLSILLDSKSLEEFLRHVDIINDFVEYNKTVIENLSNDNRILYEMDILTNEALDSQLSFKNQIKDYQKILEEKNQAAQNELAALALLEQKNEAEVKKLEQDGTNIQANIKSLIASREAAAAEEARKKAEEAARKAAEEAAKKAAEAAAKGQTVPKGTTPKGTTTPYTGTTYAGGSTIWPVVPKYSYVISSPFGSRLSPITGKWETHLGIDIPAAYGSDVKAINSGEVIMSQVYSSYGYCVVIDHGGGVTSLYAHNSKLVVKVGDKVSKGQVIAKVGSTGASTGNHCHLEISVNGQRVNPLTYLK